MIREVQDVPKYKIYLKMYLLLYLLTNIYLTIKVKILKIVVKK